MPATSETTFEEAKRCPKCQQPGDDVSSTEKYSPNKGEMVTVHVIYCRNQICPWLNTAWVVQVNADGSIPAAYEQLGDKQYPKLSPETETRVRESLEAQLRAETEPGSEIRNPYTN